MARSIYCYTCKEIKENPKLGYCRRCQRARDKVYRLRTGKTQRLRTGLCRCGNAFAPYSNCYCTKCATKWKKAYLARNPDKKKRISKKAEETRKTKADERFKYHARQMVRNALRSGMIEVKNCEVCQSNENLEAHHDDYSRPLDVRWLCRKHHVEHHNLLKE